MSNDIQISNGTIIVAESDEEFLRCTQYVKLRELLEKHTKEELARDIFHVNIKTLDAWIVKWNASGLLQRVRGLLFTALIAEDVRAANDQVAREWSQIVDRQVRTARSGKSDKTALEAAMWLHEAFIKPRMDEIEGSSDQELVYLASLEQSSYSFNPLSIGEGKDDDFEFD